MSNVLALNGETAPASTVGALQRGVLRRPVELTGEDRSRQPNTRPKVSSVAHQPAGCHHFTVRINRRDLVDSRQSAKTRAAAGEE